MKIRFDPVGIYLGIATASIALFGFVWREEFKRFYAEKERGK